MGFRVVGRVVAAAITVSLAVGAAGVGHAQPEPAEGDTGPGNGSFRETDDACGSPNYDDVYTVTAKVDERGPYLELLQDSTGDTGRLRVNESGEFVIEPENDTEIWDDVELTLLGLKALYSYVSEGCTQQWNATIELPPGLAAYVLNQSAPPEDAATPPTTLAPAAEEQEEVVVEVTTTSSTIVEAQTISSTIVEEADPIVDESADETQISQTATDNGSGSGLLVLIAIFVLAFAVFGFGWFWWFWRPKRLYRFDRGDGGTYIADDEVEMTVLGGELVLDDPEESVEGGELTWLDSASTIIIDTPPAHRLCDETHGLWVESVERLAQLEAEAEARIGTDDPIKDIHDVMLRQARDSMERYREIYEECLDAHPEHDDPPAESAPESENDDPDPAAAAGGGEDEGADGEDEGTDGDEPAPGSGSPGTSPPLPPPVTTPNCVEGSTKVEIEKQDDFRVLNGNVTARTTNSVLFGGSGISGADLGRMADGDIEDLFAPIEKLGAENKVTVQVGTRLLTVKCIRIWICSAGKWVKTEHTKRVEQYSDPQTESFRQKSQEKERSRKMVVDNVKPRLETLIASEEAAADFECDF